MVYEGPQYVNRAVVLKFIAEEIDKFYKNKKLA